jgi:hypothetical protein
MYLILITLKGLLPVLGPMDKTDVVISMQYGTILANQTPPSRNTVFCTGKTFESAFGKLFDARSTSENRSRGARGPSGAGRPFAESVKN